MVPKNFISMAETTFDYKNVQNARQILLDLT